MDDMGLAVVNFWEEDLVLPTEHFDVLHPLLALLRDGVVEDPLDRVELFLLDVDLEILSEAEVQQLVGVDQIFDPEDFFEGLIMVSPVPLQGVLVPG